MFQECLLFWKAIMYSSCKTNCSTEDCECLNKFRKLLFSPFDWTLDNNNSNYFWNELVFITFVQKWLFLMCLNIFWVVCIFHIMWDEHDISPSLNTQVTFGSASCACHKFSFLSISLRVCIHLICTLYVVVDETKIGNHENRINRSWTTITTCWHIFSNLLAHHFIQFWPVNFQTVVKYFS